MCYFLSVRHFFFNLVLQVLCASFLLTFNVFYLAQDYFRFDGHKFAENKKTFEFIYELYDSLGRENKLFLVFNKKISWTVYVEVIA